MATLAEVNVRIGADIAAFQRGLRQAEKDMQRLSGQFTTLGNKLSLGVTAPLVGAASAASAFAVGFESSTVKLTNLVGVQGKELEELKRNFTELGPVVGKTQQELADAALFITGAGLRGAAALEALEVSAKASAVGLGDQNAIAKVAGAAVAAYGEANITATEAVDKLLAIVKEGNAEASELAPALGAVLPVASQLGVSFDEVGANIAVFTRLGVGASTAVDGLRSLLGNLLKPSEQAAKEFAKLGISADQVRQSIKDRGLAQTLQDLINAFGTDTEGLARVFGDVQGFTNVLATAGAQGDAYVQTLNNIQNSAGGLEEAFARTAETADFKLKKSLAALNVAAVNFGSAIIPVVVELLDLISPLVQGFANLDEGTRSTVLTMAALAAAIGPTTTAIGGLIGGFSTLRAGYASIVKATEISRDAYVAYSTTLTSLGSSFVGLKSGLLAAAAGFRTLTAAAQTTVIGAIVTGVVALGFAIAALNDNLSVNEQLLADASEIRQQTEKDIVSERKQVELLVGVIQNNARSYADKKAAMEELKRISPEFFGNLDLERDKTTQLKSALDGYLESLRTEVAQKLYKGKIDQLEIERLTKLEKLKELEAKRNSQIGTGLLEQRSQQAVIIEEEIKATNRRIEEIGRLQEEYADLAFVGVKSAKDIQTAFAETGASLDDNALFGGGTFGGVVNKPNPLAGNAGTGQQVPRRPAIVAPGLLPRLDIQPVEQLNKVLPQVEGNLQSTRNAMASLGNAFDVIDAKGIAFGDTFDVTGEKIKAVQQVMTQLLEDGANPLGNSITYLKEVLAEMGVNVDDLASNMANLGQQINNTIELGLEEFAISSSDALGQLVAGAIDGKQALALAVEPLLGLMTQVGKLAIQQGITMKAIKASLASLNPLVSIAAGVALIGLASFIRSRVSALAKPTAFAEGGIVTGPTVGLVGEAGPEVIFPLSDLKRFIGNTGNKVEVVGSIYGDTIRISNARSAVRQARRVGFNPTV